MKKSTRKIIGKVYVIAALTVIMALGFYLRFNDLNYWNANRDLYFFNSGTLPVTIGVDSYYYMNIAANLLDGRVESFDSLRHFPVGTKLPCSAPLLSVILASIVYLTGQSMEWVAVLLPPFLGILLVIPTYLLTFGILNKSRFPIESEIRERGAILGGIAAALFVIVSPIYYAKSTIGWCDTDILNLSFITFLSFLVLKMSAPEEQGRLRSFVAYSILTLLFVWWWDSSQLLTLSIALSCLTPLLIHPHDISHRQLKLLASTMVITILLFICWKQDSLAQLTDKLIYIIRYSSGLEGSSFFPDSKSVVLEQKNISFQTLAQITAGNTSLFTLGIVGLIVMAYFVRLNFLFFFPLLILGGMALHAMRFAMFMTPLIGNGLAFLIFSLQALPVKHAFHKYLGSIALLFAIVFFPVNKILSETPQHPTFYPFILEGMQKIADATEKDAVIWTAWGEGHPLVYYSKRRTLADGMFHPIWIQYVLNYPLTTGNPRLAANWISFYTKNGEKGLDEIFYSLTGDKGNWPAGSKALAELLTVGPEQSQTILSEKYRKGPRECERLLNILFPPNCPPVYLFLNYKMVNTKWYEIGGWDLEKNRAPESYSFLTVDSYQFENNKFISGTTPFGGFRLGLPYGLVQSDWGMQYNLSSLSYDLLNSSFTKPYNSPENKRFSMHLRQNKRIRFQYGLMGNRDIVNTLFIKLFFSRPNLTGNSFSIVIDETPGYLLLKVKGECYQDDTD